MKNPLIKALGLAVVLVFASGTNGSTTPPVFAGNTVDPSTLEPVPPNAVCHEAGGQIICDTFIDDVLVNEPNPDFALPCGTVYETSHYRGDGTRWYVNRLAVRRHVAASLDGTLSLSPTGAGPVVRISGHWSSNSIWATPGDDITVVVTSDSGNASKVSAPGVGVILHIAGIYYPDGTSHGLPFAFPFTPEVEAALCAALTP